MANINIESNKRLAPISTFDIGGEAQHFTKIKNNEELKQAVKWANDKGLNYKICADASNIVFTDNTLNGLLIKIADENIERQDDKKLMVSAGTNLLKLVRTANALGLSGLETLAGIPGTVGGAIVGNAGAYGHSISEAVEKVEVFDGNTTFWITKEKCEFGYRESVFKHNSLIVTRAQLKLHKKDPSELQEKSKKIIEAREKKYKPNLKCPGSFFKNVLVKDVDKKVLEKIDESKIIEGKIPAGYLLEKVGAKGMKEGGIQIAGFHGNLFINRGEGTAHNVKKLSKKLKNRVMERFNIKLEEEIRYFD